MTVLVTGWIVAMWLIVLYGAGTGDSEAVIGLQFIAMLAGVLLIGTAGMLNIS